ncbi:glycosyltransferase, partial [Campylobacter jejuni]
MPKLSVIVPTFNRSSLLQKAVQSILNQDFKDLEIIISDDNSSDDT